MSEFIKAGNKILNKPNGFDYDLINGKFIILSMNDTESVHILKKMDL